jgi:hypothetical protein
MQEQSPIFSKFLFVIVLSALIAASASARAGLTTLPATAVTPDSAVLYGTVNANGGTGYASLEYGTGLTFVLYTSHFQATLSTAARNNTTQKFNAYSPRCCGPLHSENPRGAHAL